MKNKNVKAILALLLAQTMLLSTITVVYAEEETAAEESSEEAEESAAEEPAETDGEEGSEEVQTYWDDVDEEYLDGEGLTYGLILTTLDNPVYVEMQERIEAICEETGMEFMIQTAGDTAAKVTAIESCVEAGCDIICYMADASTECDDAVAAAKEAGVTVGSLGAAVNGVDRGFIDNMEDKGYAVGQMTGEWINETFGSDEEVEVGLLTYTPAEFVLVMDENMRQGLADTAPNAVIVAEDNVYTPPTGMTATENFLQANPDIKAIMGFCDSCALGGYQAFLAGGLDDEEHGVFGADGIEEAMAAIEEGGSYRGTVFNGGGTYQGERMGKQLLAIHNGYEFEDEGIEYFPAIEVTAENIAEYR